jgi:hypothetical protein
MVSHSSGVGSLYCFHWVLLPLVKGRVVSPENPLPCLAFSYCKVPVLANPASLLGHFRLLVALMPTAARAVLAVFAVKQKTIGGTPRKRLMWPSRASCSSQGTMSEGSGGLSLAERPRCSPTLNAKPPSVMFFSWKVVLPSSSPPHMGRGMDNDPFVFDRRSGEVVRRRSYAN